MSIKIENLTKFYGTQKALDQINLSINPGQITGLLGPNGAGKSTLMKIIACFIPPSEGSANVYGFDVIQSSLEVRKLIGYLPENNPLYPDMYVKEFLLFVAGLYTMGKSSAERVDHLIKLTGLTKEVHKKIGQLSKGYKQRVGLAQALIHDPQVLILDEPTSGLDPNQIIEIRNLIQEIGHTKTVIFSTHIMQEVEALCKRVIIMNQGKIVADENTAILSSRMNGSSFVTLEYESPVDEKLLLSIQGVIEVIRLDDLHFRLLVKEDVDIRGEIFRFSVDHNWTVLSMQRENQNLEGIFRNFTLE
jgi:ABC-2 type transport system ATP-binding protein